MRPTRDAPSTTCAAQGWSRIAALAPLVIECAAQVRAAPCAMPASCLCHTPLTWCSHNGIMRSSSQGDSVSDTILKHGVGELFRAVKAVTTKLDIERSGHPFRLVLAGGTGGLVGSVSGSLGAWCSDAQRYGHHLVARPFCRHAPTPAPAWRSPPLSFRSPSTHALWQLSPHTSRAGGLLSEGCLYTQYLLEVLKEACPSADICYPAVEPAEAAAWLAFNAARNKGAGGAPQ